jgi:regulation of enolase protein 1 (concanavalin A-like superfamily)
MASSIVRDVTGRFRGQLVKILESPEFASSAQVRQFLEFVGEAALAGRNSLDQIEIAEGVLGRGADFNPVEDASVRRIATLCRQKLKLYYDQHGLQDPVIVTLPLRSYVPLFRLREDPEFPEPKLAVRLPRSRWLLVAIAAVALFAATAILAWRSLAPGPYLASRSGTFDMLTHRGSIEGEGYLVPPNSILLGPATTIDQDVTVRMRFSPEEAYQQAGIMIYQGPNQYIKLGRHFSGRVNWEFGLEEAGRYARSPQTWTYDPWGQDSTPVWLLIRRRGDVFRGFVSQDGYSWRQVGTALQPSQSMKDARVALFAFNGLTAAREAPVHFDQFGAGLTFWNDPGESVREFPPAGWHVVASSNCDPERNARPIGDLLEFRYSPTYCIWHFVRGAPSGDWVLTTKMDMLPVSGAIAGLVVRGSKGRLRLARWSLQGGSIAVDFPPANQEIRMADYPGHPPITLRLEARAGKVGASFSRDEVHFTRVSDGFPLDQLGKEIEFGLITQSTSWNQAGDLPSARFYYVRQEALRLDAAR